MTDIRSSTERARHRAIGVFNYLAELARLRAKTVRDIDTYEDVFWFESIPSDRDCHTIAWGSTEDDSDDVWLSVKKRDEPKCPSPPHECLEWVDERILHDSSGRPTLCERIPIIAAAASETENLVEEFSKPTEFALLDDNPDVVAQFDAYVVQKWLQWAKLHQDWKELQSCYSALFKIHQNLQRLGEQFELVIGLGFLTWKVKCGERVRRHVFVADATLEFDASSGAFHVRSGAEGSRLRLEIDMLLPGERPSATEQQAVEMAIQATAEDIWDRSTLFPALRGWSQSLEDKGEFDESLRPQDDVLEKPQIRFAPALVLRRRTSQSMLGALDVIIKQLQDTEKEIPLEILRLVSDPDDFEHAIDNGDLVDNKNSKSIPRPVLFPLPANEEQLQIVHAINRQRGVLVQGPPGTGKSHTIANLICHLLATGKKVLITAQTPRALRVLQDKLPTEIAPLCVSLLGNDVSALRNLEHCIAEIGHRHALWDRDRVRNQEELASIEALLFECKKQLASLGVSLQEIREAETRIHEIVDGAFRGTAQKIAEQLLAQDQDFEWLQDTLPVNSKLPFRSSTFSQLRDSLVEIDGNRIAELKHKCPSPSSILTVEQIVQLIRDERIALELTKSCSAAREGRYFRGLIEAPEGSSDHLGQALRALSVAIQNIERRPLKWIPNAIYGILADQDTPWKSLRDITQGIVIGLRERTVQVERHSIKWPAETSTDTLLANARDLIQHLKNGGKLGWWIFKPAIVKRTRPILRQVHVDGRMCESIEQLEILVESLEIQRSIEQLWRLWSSKIEKKDVALALQVSEFEEHLEALLAVLGIESFLDSAKSACKQIAGLGEPRWHDPKDVERLMAACDAASAEKRLRAVRARFDSQHHGLNQLAAGGNAHPVVRDLVKAIEMRDAESYGRCIKLINKIKLDIDRVRERSVWQSQLRSVAPILEQELNRTPSDATWEGRLARIEEAWNWARAKNWLKEYLRPGLQRGLEVQIAEIQKTISDQTAKLAAANAWQFFFERLSEGQRQHLNAWQQAIKRIGKGTGRHAARHRRDAQAHLDKCRGAIPAWIMPLFRVLDTISPAPEMFDVLIVDEASQCGPEAVILLYMAKRVIIVGDDQQISPEAVGINQDDVEYLARQHLSEIDHRDSFGVTSSLFDHGVIRYGNRIVLREHFRCMPEIIRFSNDLCYSNTPLIPLRQYPPQRLKPIVPQYIRSGHREGSASQVLNRPEAEALVSAIVACCRDPKYSDKSMGVISLQGDSQAHLIETRLLEELDIKEIEERRIVCGDAYSFQGDERDVMFLSLVAAPNGRIGAMTREADKRRFNVAASRARDQMWLFHSVELGDLANSCVRRELLKYCLNPVSQRITIEGLNVDDVQRRAAIADRRREAPPKPFESWFEVDVFLRIIARGYRVIPQYEVAGYRIDLVVEGISSRLAVEVDGDEWHGTESYESDLDRQRRLERCGWKFWRVRGSEFYCDPDKALRSLWGEIEARKIEVACDQFGPSEIDGYVPELGCRGVAVESEQAPQEATSPESLVHDQASEEANEVQHHTNKPQVPSSAENPRRDMGNLIVPPALNHTLDDTPAPSSRATGDTTQNAGGAQDDLVLKVMLIPSGTWLAMSRWSREREFLSGKDRKMLYSIGRKSDRGDPLSWKQARYALDLHKKCIEAGFRENQGHVQ